MIFLKLGGSLITNKSQPETARHAIIERLAQEIQSFMQDQQAPKLLIGHGSGSFGHFTAAKYNTQAGAANRTQWIGFTQVWAAANRLNRIIVDALLSCDLPVISFPPSASATSCDGELKSLSVAPIHQALKAGLLPLVQGDVAFDQRLGSTIVSTEKVFAFLARELRPDLILLAGIEPGVYQHFPSRRDVLEEITEDNLDQIAVIGSEATDVTGGMADKVNRSLALCKQVSGLKVRIFSAEEPGSLKRALHGAQFGTLIRSVRSELPNAPANPKHRGL